MEADANPELVHVSTDRLNTECLVDLLSESDYRIDSVEEVVRADAGLSWRLLLEASRVGSQRVRASSLQQVLNVLGRDGLRDWVLRNIHDSADDSSADRELAAAVLIRARFCEEITSLVPEAGRDEGFLAGLLSGVVDILGADVDAVMRHAAVSLSIECAVRSGAGPLAVPMSMIRSPSIAVGAAREAGLDQRAVTYAYLDAVSVAGRMLRRGPDTSADELPRGSEIGRRLSVARWNESAAG